MTDFNFCLTEWYESGSPGKDEFGRFTIELNDFANDLSGELTQTWIRLPPQNIRVQVGMVPGLFGDNSFEKAAIKAGVMKQPKRPAAPIPVPVVY